MPKTIGIQIGKTRVSGALLARQGGRPVVLGFATAPLRIESTATRTDALLDAVNLVMDELGATTEDVVASIPSERCILSSFTVPFTDRRKITETIKYDAESEIPCSADAVVLDWYETRKSKHSCCVTTIAVKKEVLRDHLELLERCDINPVAVQPDFCALHNAISAVNGKEASCLVFCLADKHITLLASMQDAPTVYMESELDGSSPTKAVSEFLGILETRLPDEDTYNVTIIGDGGEQREQIAAMFGDENVREISFQDIASNLDGGKREEFLQHGLVAYGLALREMQPVKVDCDLRREELAYPERFQPIITPLALLLCTLFLILFVVGFSLQRTGEAKKGELTAINAAMEERWRKSFHKSNPLPAGALTRMKSELTLIKGPGKGLNLKYADYTLPALKDVVDRMKKTGVDFKIRSMELRQGTVSRFSRTSGDPVIILEASLATSDVKACYETMDMIKESPFVSSVSNQGELRPKDGRLPVVLHIVLNYGIHDTDKKH